MNDKGIGQLSGLAGRLVAEGLISAEEATEAQREASMEQVPLVSFLVEKKNVDSDRLAAVASQEFGVPQFDATNFDLTAIPQGVVEVDLILKHHALPIYRRGNRRQ